MRLSQFLQISFLFSIALILSLIFIPNLNLETKNRQIEILNFTTDKKTYGSYEEMKILVLLKSPKDVENVTINVFGIRPRVYAYVNESKIVNLKEGENEIVFLAKTPYCTSGCGGVYPGPYDLYAKVFFNGKEVTNSTTTINLAQG
jgi:hypothetical protein